MITPTAANNNLFIHFSFVDTAKNLTDTFHKYVVEPFMEKASVIVSHVYTFIQNHSTGCCVALLIPIIVYVAFKIFDNIKSRSIQVTPTPLEPANTSYYLEESDTLYSPTSASPARTASEATSAPATPMTTKQNNPSSPAVTSPSRALMLLQQVLSSLTIKVNEEAEIIEKAVKAVKEDGLVLEQCCDIAKNNVKVVLAAVEQNGLALQFASPNMQNNRQIALAATKQNPEAFKYVAESLQTEVQFALEACEQNLIVFYFVKREIKHQLSFILNLIERNTLAFTKVVTKDSQKDPEFIKKVLQRNGLVLQFITLAEHTSKDIEIYLVLAISQNGLAFQFAPDKYKKDKTYILKAIQQNYEAFQFVPKYLQSDEDVLSAVRKAKLNTNVFSPIRYVKSLISPKANSR